MSGRRYRFARTATRRPRAGGWRIGDAVDGRQPTVVADVPVDARVLVDEPFGAMATMRGVVTLEDTIAVSNRRR